MFDFNILITSLSFGLSLTSTLSSGWNFHGIKTANKIILSEDNLYLKSNTA